MDTDRYDQYCVKCGVCCEIAAYENILGLEELIVKMPDGTKKCKYYDRTVHQCANYDNRPAICKNYYVHEKYYSNNTFSQYMIRNIDGCIDYIENASDIKSRDKPMLTYELKKMRKQLHLGTRQD
jgi:Fe-S-cluster containining protein